MPSNSLHARQSQLLEETTTPILTDVRKELTMSKSYSESVVSETSFDEFEKSVLAGKAPFGKSHSGILSLLDESRPSDSKRRK